MLQYGVAEPCGRLKRREEIPCARRLTFVTRDDPQLRQGFVGQSGIRNLELVTILNVGSTNTGYTARNL
jgi:hypothetical protein